MIEKVNKNNIGHSLKKERDCVILNRLEVIELYDSKLDEAGREFSFGSK